MGAADGSEVRIVVDLGSQVAIRRLVDEGLFTAADDRVMPELAPAAGLAADALERFAEPRSFFKALVGWGVCWLSGVCDRGRGRHFCAGCAVSCVTARSVAPGGHDPSASRQRKPPARTARAL